VYIINLLNCTQGCIYNIILKNMHKTYEIWWNLYHMINISDPSCWLEHCLVKNGQMILVYIIYYISATVYNLDSCVIRLLLAGFHCNGIIHSICLPAWWHNTAWTLVAASGWNTVWVVAENMASFCKVICWWLLDSFPVVYQIHSDCTFLHVEWSWSKRAMYIVCICIQSAKYLFNLYTLCI